MATVDVKRPAFVAAQRVVFENLQDLPVTSMRYEVGTVGPDERPRHHGWGTAHAAGGRARVLLGYRPAPGGQPGQRHVRQAGRALAPGGRPDRRPSRWRCHRSSLGRSAPRRRRTRTSDRRRRCVDAGRAAMRRGRGRGGSRVRRGDARRARRRPPDGRRDVVRVGLEVRQRRVGGRRDVRRRRREATSRRPGSPGMRVKLNPHVHHPAAERRRDPPARAHPLPDVPVLGAEPEVAHRGARRVRRPPACRAQLAST